MSDYVHSSAHNKTIKTSVIGAYADLSKYTIKKSQCPKWSE